MTRRNPPLSSFFGPDASLLLGDAGHPWSIGSLARADDLSALPPFATRLSAQFEQPVFGMNVGLGALRHSSWSSAAVIQASEHLLLSYLYSMGNPDAEAPAGVQRAVGSPGDEVTTEIPVPAGARTLHDELDRYALVAHDPPSAFLACCQFWKPELKELSQPVLIAIAAPMTAPGRAPISP